MKDFLRAITATILLAQIIVVFAPWPAAALSADLANKRRDMAIKSHPPPSPPGDKAYAQAEREFFRTCVSKNGQMPGTDAPNPK
jgi:hypothetical protein